MLPEQKKELQYPEDGLKELNSDANSEKLVELCKISKPRKKE